MWANEQEAATLSGYSPDEFRKILPALEAAGFPPKLAWNDKRFIPAIEDFWRRQLDAIAPPVPQSGPQNIRDYEDTPNVAGKRFAS